MNTIDFKKHFNWKTAALLSMVTLAGCDGCACHEDEDDAPTSASLTSLMLLAPMVATTSSTNTDQTLLQNNVPATNAAVFSINWNKKAETINQNGKTINVPAGNYQLSLPFSDYTKTNEAISPDNHFQPSQGFHFGMPLLENAETQSNTPFSVSFTPVANSQQQLAENTQWLSAEGNLSASEQTTTNSTVRLYQPITLKRDNQTIATMNTLVVEKTQIEQGNSVNLTLKGMYQSIKTQKDNASYGPGRFAYEFSNLDAALVHQLEREVVDIKHMPKDKQMAMQFKMLTQLKELCKKESTMTVTYDVNSAQGPVTQHYTVNLANLVNGPTQFAGPMPIDLGLIFASK